MKISFFILLGLFFLLVFWSINESRLTGYAGGTGGGEGEDDIGGDETGSSSGGGGSSEPSLYSLPSGETYQSGSLTTFATGDVMASDITYSSKSSSLSDNLQGSLKASVSRGSSVEISLSNTRNVEIYKSGRKLENIPVTLKRSGTFLGITGFQEEASFELTDAGSYEVKFEVSPLKVTKTEKTLINSAGQSVGKTISVINNERTSFQSVVFLTEVEVETQDPVITVIHNGEIIPSNLVYFSENEAQVSFTTDVGIGPNSISIFAVDVEENVRVIETEVSENDIPTEDEVPEFCKQNVDCRSVDVCAIESNAAKIVSSRANDEFFEFDVTTRQLCEQIRRGCPLAYSKQIECNYPINEVDPTRDVKVYESETGGSRKDVVVYDLDTQSEAVQLSIGDEKVDIIFLDREIPRLAYSDYCYNGVMDENEEGIDCGGECRECAQFSPYLAHPLFDYLKWGLWIVLGFMIFILVFTFRDKDFSTVKSLVSLGKNEMLAGKWNEAIESYHLAKKMYSGLPSEKKRLLAKDYFEFEKLLGRNQWN